MKTLSKEHLLTKKQAEAVIRHLETDMSYGSEGTFYKEGSEYRGGNDYDVKDAQIVKAAIHRIKEYLTQE